MCGRYTLSGGERALKREFGVHAGGSALLPRYNVAPSQAVPVVRRDPDGTRRLDMLRWGLVPGWARDRSIGNRLINARAETVAAKPAFRSAFQRRRCLIPADGFYEWRALAGARQPYWIGFSDRSLFAFAGLWERWKAAEDGPFLETCTVITTDANRVVATVHGRMPVILPPGAYDAWLDPASTRESLGSLLRPCSDQRMVAYPVSRRVNDPRNEGADLSEPMAGTEV